jgi:hypothetical protein
MPATCFAIGEDGTVQVEVHLTARDLKGNSLFDTRARRFDVADQNWRVVVASVGMRVISQENVEPALGLEPRTC